MSVELRRNHAGKVLITKDGLHILPTELSIQFYPGTDIVQISSSAKTMPEKKMSVGDKQSYTFGEYKITIERLDNYGMANRNMINLQERNRLRKEGK